MSRSVEQERADVTTSSARRGTSAAGRRLRGRLRRRGAAAAAVVLLGVTLSGCGGPASKPADACTLLRSSPTAASLETSERWETFDGSAGDGSAAWKVGCGVGSLTNFFQMVMSSYSSSSDADLDSLLSIDGPHLNKDWWQDASGPGDQAATFADSSEASGATNGAAMRVGGTAVVITAQHVSVDQLVEVLKELEPAVKDLG